ncbi:MAG: ice-binding family protein [Betaproteobacteria bacterium]
MNKHKNESGSFTWLMAVLLSGLIAACGGGGDGGGTSGTGGSAAPGAIAVPGTVGAPGAAATNPTVGSSGPVSGATNVATSTNSSANVRTGTSQTATFSEAMNPATVTAPGTFTLRETVSGTNVPGTVTMNAANTIATFTPTAAALLVNTSYTATVSTAATNATGTAMPNTVAWSFTTSAAASTAQAPVNLLTAGNFVILTKAGITNVHTSAITGNIGASPITAATMDNVFCSEITGTIFGVDAAYTGSGAVTCFAGNPPLANKTLVDNAVLDMGTAFNDAKGRTTPDFVDLGAGSIGGLTLAPGLYKWNTGVLIATDVTISGSASDVWIFQIAGDITQSNGIKVTLAGGALAKNIFWQVDGGTGVAIGTTAQMNGVILAIKAITLATGAVANSRLFAQTEVTLQQNAVTQPAP